MNDRYDKYIAALRKIRERVEGCYEYVVGGDNAEKCQSELFYLIGHIEGICDMVQVMEELKMEEIGSVTRHPK